MVLGDSARAIATLRRSCRSHCLSCRCHLLCVRTKKNTSGSQFTSPWKNVRFVQMRHVLMQNMYSLSRQAMRTNRHRISRRIHLPVFHRHESSPCTLPWHLSLHNDGRKTPQELKATLATPSPWSVPVHRRIVHPVPPAGSHLDPLEPRLVPPQKRPQVHMSQMRRLSSDPECGLKRRIF